MKPINKSNYMSYMGSFLALLVLRAGGKLVIEHLSELAGKNIAVAMALDIQGDKVTLETKAQDVKVQARKFM
jgi:hypothetical protein